MFYVGSPDKGPYIDYLSIIEKKCTEVLEAFKGINGRTLIIDFDDTIAWTSPASPVQNKKVIRNGKVFYHYDKLDPMINMVKTAQKMGYNIIVITARHMFMLESTYSNLEEFGIYNAKVFTNTGYNTNANFKSIMRQNLEHVTFDEAKRMTSDELLYGNFRSTKGDPKKSYPKIGDKNLIKIILSIGDRWADVINHADVLGVKLPDPMDNNAYFYLNGEKKIIS